jgi:hypothetical protein
MVKWLLELSTEQPANPEQAKEFWRGYRRLMAPPSPSVRQFDPYNPKDLDGWRARLIVPRPSLEFPCVQIVTSFPDHHRGWKVGESVQVAVLSDLDAFAEGRAVTLKPQAPGNPYAPTLIAETTKMVRGEAAYTAHTIEHLDHELTLGELALVYNALALATNKTEAPINDQSKAMALGGLGLQ